MDIFLLGTIIAGLTAGSLTGLGLRSYFARKIEGLVLSGSRYHLAQTSSGAVELRSGVRSEVLTKREALALGPGLKQLSSDVRSNPFLALRLLSKKHEAAVQAKSFEDSFLEAAVKSQRNELTRLAEEKGLGVSAARLIHAAREDSDFAILKSMIGEASFGAELPDELLQKLGLEERRELEPLVLWSTSTRAASGQQKQLATHKPTVGEEIPSLPGHTISTRLAGRGGEYERIVVEIFKDGERLNKDEVYTGNHRADLESAVARRKSQLIQRVKSLSALGV